MEAIFGSGTVWGSQGGLDSLCVGFQRQARRLRGDIKFQVVCVWQLWGAKADDVCVE